MRTLDLKLQSKNSDYQIVIGKGLLCDKEHFTSVIKGQQVFIVSNDTVAPLYLDTLKNTLQDYQLHQYILKDGEQYKSFDNYHKILDSMLTAGLRRNATLVALGGGVVGDMAGFAAATYQRGIPFIQVPTTVLSQVDSSVGGKTAVNHPKGKNLIGAFHQPSCVITDVDTLKTLPRREFKAGLAEIIKAAIIHDARFFKWLEDNLSLILAGNEPVLMDMIEQSCKIKAAIVSMDEKELGVRAWLNLGHTFGHAIERAFGFGVLLHGEAVAIGMAMAADLSSDIGLLDNDSSLKIQGLIKKFGLPMELPMTEKSIDATQLVEAMSLDKKNVDADLTLVLPKSIGEVTIKHSIKKQDVEQFLKRYLKQAS